MIGMGDYANENTYLQVSVRCSVCAGRARCDLIRKLWRQIGALVEKEMEMGEVSSVVCYSAHVRCVQQSLTQSPRSWN